MATKSFMTEFKFSARDSHKLLAAIENSNSKKASHNINQRVSNASGDDIKRIMGSFLGRDQ